jgi:hypothetical protein
MDIHTLNSRPSQLLLGKYVSAAAPSASIAASVSGESALGMRASPSRPRAPDQTARTSSQALLNGIVAQHGRALNRKTSRPSLTGRVGGWVWGKWSSTSAASSHHENESVSSANSSIISAEGRTKPLTLMPSQVTTVATTSTEASTAPVAVPAAKSLAQNLAVSPRKVLLRSPGVNQSGPIWGFAPDKKLDPIPVMKTFNADALKDVLEEQS